jgi:hypothetical protein
MPETSEVPVADDVPDAAQERRARRRRIWTRVALVYTGAWCLVLLVCVGSKVKGCSALNAEVRALHAAGEPVTCDEVLAGIEPIPDDENSSLLLSQHRDAIRGWMETPLGDIVWRRQSPASGTRFSEEMLQLMGRLLAEQSDVLNVVREAGRHPRGRWPAAEVLAGRLLQWDSHSPYSVTRAAVRLLRVETDLHANEGDVERVAPGARTVLRMGASLDETPDVVGLLLRMACGASAVGAVEDALSLGELRAEDLAMLGEEFAMEAKRVDMRTTLRFERAEAYRYRCKGAPSYSGEPLSHYKTFFWRISPSVDSGMLRVMRAKTETIAAFDLPPREQLATFERMQARWEAWDTSLGWWQFSDMLARLFLRDVGEHPIRLVGYRQKLMVARAALAVERFRMARGRWPDKFLDLVPDYLDAVPQDWFASEGETIGYARTQAGVRLWSRYRENEIVPWLAASEMRAFMGLASAILRFRKSEGRLPTDLAELDEDKRGPVPIDPLTSEPYTYVTNRAHPKMFILGGYTGGKREDEFWKLSWQIENWIEEEEVHRTVYGGLFRMLEPELRGVDQQVFRDELLGGDAEISRLAGSLDALGYTAERLKELGFSDEDLNGFEKAANSARYREAKRKVEEEVRHVDKPSEPRMEPAP